MLGITFGLGSLIISANAVHPLEGNIFYVGEKNTDPGEAMTVKERVEVFFEDVDFTFGEPTCVIGQRIFARLLADGRELVYAKDFDVAGDDSIIIDASTDQLSYEVGGVITVSAEAVHGQTGSLSGCNGILTAGIFPEIATGVTSLCDDGVDPDPVAGDGIFTGDIRITNGVAGSGGNNLPLFIIAQHTYHELDTGKIPNFSVGFKELRVNVDGIPPSSDVLAFLYDCEPEMVQGSESSLKIEVRNIGQAETDNIFTVEAWMSLDDEIDDSDELIGSLEVDELPAHKSVWLVLPFRVPILDGAGDYFILLRADSGNNISECNKENNLLVSGFTLLERRATP